MVQITSGLSAGEQVVLRAPGQNRTQGTGTQTTGNQSGTGGTRTSTRTGS